MNRQLQRIRQSIIAEFGNSCERCLSEISTVLYWILDPSDDRPTNDPAYAQILYHPLPKCLEINNPAYTIMLFAALDKCLLSKTKNVEKCEGVIFCPGALAVTAWWIELKMNMTMRLKRRDGQLQTMTLGCEVQKAVNQILSSRQNLRSRVASLHECKDRGHIGIPSNLEKRRGASPHINQLIRRTQKEQGITITIGSKLTLK